MKVTGNKNGIKICKCCASCKYKEMTDLMRTRRCTLFKKKVKSRQWCDCWEMNEKLNNVGGNSDGKVKKKEYFDYLVGVRVREQNREDRGEPVTPKTFEEIRRTFKHRNRTTLYLID